MMTEERARYWRGKYNDLMEGFLAEAKASGDEGIAYIGILRLECESYFNGTLATFAVRPSVDLLRDVVANAVVSVGEVAAMTIRTTEKAPQNENNQR